MKQTRPTVEDVLEQQEHVENEDNKARSVSRSKSKGSQRTNSYSPNPTPRKLQAEDQSKVSDSHADHSFMKSDIVNISTEGKLVQARSTPNVTDISDEENLAPDIGQEMKIDWQPQRVGTPKASVLRSMQPGQ